MISRIPNYYLTLVIFLFQPPFCHQNVLKSHGETTRWFPLPPHSPCKLEISNPSKDWKLIKQTCKSLFNTAVEFWFFDSSWNIKKSQYFVNKKFCYRFSILLVVGIKDKNCGWKNFLTSKVNDDFTVQQGFWKMIGNSKLNLTASSPWKLQYFVLANNNKTIGSSFVFHVKTRIFFNQNKDHPMNS